MRRGGRKKKREDGRRGRRGGRGRGRGEREGGRVRGEGEGEGGCAVIHCMQHAFERYSQQKMHAKVSDEMLRCANADVPLLT